MFVRAPHYVKKCLLPSLAALLAVVVAACSQTSEPEGVEEPVSPVVEEPEKKPRPGSGKKTPGKRVNAPAVMMVSPAPEEFPAPATEPEDVETVAPVFPPVEAVTPFVPSAPGKRIAHVSVPGPYVAVTFDDGPSAALTPQVLDIFARHGAHATFFVQGQNANRNRSILARAVAEGHEVGSHTWSHINMRASGTDTIIRELDRTSAVIEAATGSRPKVMRPPYGATNRALIDMVYSRYGMPAILWDVDTNDWRKPGVQTVINRAVGKAKPGSIILLHDIHSSTVKAVEGIVTGLQARGFKLVTVSELIAMGRQAAGGAAPAVDTPAADVPAVVAGEEATPAVPATPVADGQPVPGAASIGALPAPLPQQPAPVVLPAEPAPVAPAAQVQPTPTIPAEDDFNFYEEP